MNNINLTVDNKVDINEVLYVIKNFNTTNPKISNNTKELSITIEDANLWAKNNLNIDYVDYTGFDIKIANSTNEQLYLLQTLYPEIHMKWLSTFQGHLFQYRQCLNLFYEDYINKKGIRFHKKSFDEKVLDKIKEDLKCDGLSFDKTCGKYSGIWLNRNAIGNYDSYLIELKQLSRDKTLPLGCDNVTSLVTHEFGHQIMFFLQENNLFDFAEDIWETNKYNPNEGEYTYIENGLSVYGDTNIQEFFADAFLEYTLSKNPRPIAQSVGLGLEKVLCEYRTTYKRA